MENCHQCWKYGGLLLYSILCWRRKICSCIQLKWTQPIDDVGFTSGLTVWGLGFRAFSLIIVGHGRLWSGNYLGICMNWRSLSCKMYLIIVCLLFTSNPGCWECYGKISEITSNWRRLYDLPTIWCFRHHQRRGAIYQLCLGFSW